MNRKIELTHEDISSASTLPSFFYTDDQLWERVKEDVFCPSWQFIGSRSSLFDGQHNMVPKWILENYLDEPILLIEDDEGVRCLSNVCTHRGFILLSHPSKAKKISCQYHGRRFDLQGKFEYMPEFKEALNFPSPCDNLPRLELKQWRDFLFTSVRPDTDFEGIKELLEEKLYFLPIETFRHATEYSKTYNVHAHWSLYCDNFLEGFHIPFVHDTLSKVIDYGSYTTECFDQVVLQIGYATDSDFKFDLPKDHPDYGKDVAAYYYWLFPNFMLNFYPWGVQTNVVKPVNPSFAKVEFEYFIYSDEIFQLMRGDLIAEKTEREDEFVVEAVQRGIRSRFYDSGRFSPSREQGVHHFHRLLSQAITG